MSDADTDCIHFGGEDSATYTAVPIGGDWENGMHIWDNTTNKEYEFIPGEGFNGAGFD